MLTILKRSFKDFVMGYCALAGFVSIIASLTHPDVGFTRLLLVEFIPGCLWWAVLMDFGNHSRWMNPVAPWRDPTYKEAGINELGSITKYP